MKKTLCEKYRANCFIDIKGQDLAIDKIKNFIKNFPAKKALIMHGPPGSGKTSIAYALASELNAEILELNASDFRNKEHLERSIKPASEQESLFKKAKLILIDEVDGIAGNEDRGGMQELLTLIDNTSHPMIITANDIWDRKFSSLIKKCELIEIKELNYVTVVKMLHDICLKEKKEVNSNVLSAIAVKARGDIRAALNDLQTVLEQKELSAEMFAERDKENSIFNALRNVFKSTFNESTLGMYDSVNLNLDEIMLWLEENIPLEYKGEELFKAYEALSLADVFRGRIHRQQHWRFLAYQNILLSAGISAAKKQAKTGFTSYKKPTRILKIWLANQKNAKKKSIAAKLAPKLHIGKKQAFKDLYVLRAVKDKDELGKELRLENEEIDYLKNF
jgi:replication factor C large subunit